MIILEGGTFLMGSDDPSGFPADGEGPVRKIRIKPFHIAATLVTVAEFACFTAKTGHLTESERFGLSFVFQGHLSAEVLSSGVVRRVPGSSWWLGDAGGCWKAPFGPGSDIRGREDHPVTHVSWNDAAAYCNRYRVASRTANTPDSATTKLGFRMAADLV